MGANDLGYGQFGPKRQGLHRGPLNIATCILNIMSFWSYKQIKKIKLFFKLNFGGLTFKKINAHFKFCLNELPVYYLFKK